MYLKKIKIGNVELDNNLILAPMAGVTNLPFRIICEKFEPGMVCTEMVSSKAIFYNDQKTRRLLNTEGEKRPISFQIFGSDEETMGYTAKYMSKIADIIDFNMGCPAPKIVKNGDGSNLLLHLDLLEKIVMAIRENTEKPIIEIKHKINIIFSALPSSFTGIEHIYFIFCIKFFCLNSLFISIPSKNISTTIIYVKMVAVNRKMKTLIN